LSEPVDGAASVDEDGTAGDEPLPYGYAGKRRAMTATATKADRHSGDVPRLGCYAVLVPRSSVVSRIAQDVMQHSPSLMPPPMGQGSVGKAEASHKPPWWQTLAKDFSRRPEPFQLALGDALSVRASAASDVVARTAAASLLASLAVPLGYHPWRLRQALADLEVYGEIVSSGDPSRFFRAPERPARVHARTSRTFPDFRPVGGLREILTFDSPFMPIAASQHRDYLKHRHNRQAHARYFRHGGGPRPTIIAIHGFSADLYLVNEWLFALPWFYHMGCDVLLFTLPFHGPRRMNGSLFSGHGYFAGGPSRINEAVAQSVLDLRVLIDWLERERGVTDVGVTGVSLGGFTAAALACSEPRLKFAIPNVPVVSLADLVLEWEPIGTLVRTVLKATKRDVRDLRELLAVSCPLTWAPQLPPERLMIVAGVGDRLAPPKHSRILWDHWNRCRIHWFPGSHLLHLDRGAYLKEIARFLGGIGFLPPRD